MNMNSNTAVKLSRNDLLESKHHKKCVFLLNCEKINKMKFFHTKKYIKV